MAYSKTNWANGTTPAISAANLNKIEKGIFDATSATENIKLVKNLVSSIVDNKYATENSGKVVISDDSNRAYTKIAVKGGVTYAVNTGFSGNFSMWAYKDGTDDIVISKISPVPTNRVITAPSNAEFLYLSNSGWDVTTDLVVLESTTSIVGYSKTDYPFNTLVEIDIPLLKMTTNQQSTIQNMIDTVVNPIADVVEDYEDNVILLQNLVTVIYDNSNADDVQGKIGIFSNAGRGCTKISVKGGHTYAINKTFSSNFSMWGYTSGSDDYLINKITPPDNLVITAPNNATVLYLSNAGWTSSTDLVVLEVNTSIIGYSKTDYPFGQIKSVSIPNLFQMGEIDTDIDNAIKMTPIEHTIGSICRIGYSGFPENSVIAFKEAYKHGFRAMLCDVRFTSDDVPVLLHDKTINRIARNSDGTSISSTINIGDITLAQANTYDYGIATGSQFAGMNIPTLQEVCEFCKWSNSEIYIELKDVPTDANLNAMFAVLDNFNFGKALSFTCDRMSNLQRVAPHYPFARLGYGSAFSELIADRVRDLKALKTYNNYVFIHTLIENDYPLTQEIIDLIDGADYNIGLELTEIANETMFANFMANPFNVYVTRCAVSKKTMQQYLQDYLFND